MSSKVVPVSDLEFQRRLLRISQRTVADQAGLSQASVSHAETGRATGPVVERVTRALERLKAVSR